VNTAKVVTAAVMATLLRRQYLRWGAAEAEVRMRLPGDELMARANLTATRAITIGTPAADVWPWIAQLGQGRGGFYSYDFLENLIGCDIDGTSRLVVRERYGYARRWAALLVEPVAPISFVMSRRMLHGIKQRAERTARPLPA
jgi:hypothetical protein